MNKTCAIYIMTNYLETSLYIGVTSNLQKRVWEHKNKVVKGFIEKYNVDKLVYYDISFLSNNKIVQRIKKKITMQKYQKY